MKTEAEIAQAFQAPLAVPVRVAVKRCQAHLHLLLNRSPQTQLDYLHLGQEGKPRWRPWEEVTV